MIKKIASHFKNNKDLYLIALNLGLTGFGGLAIVNRIKEEYVTKRKIISEQKFLHALSLAQILPGSTIINLIAFFNYLSAGLIGALIGTAIYILPTFLITTLFSVIYFRYPHEQSINKIVLSLNILLISLLIKTLFSLGRSVFIREKSVDHRSIIIASICFYLYIFYGLSAVWVFLISGLLGIFLYTFTGFFNTKPMNLPIASGAFFKHKKAWIILITFLILFSFSIAYISTPLWVLFSSFFKIGSLSFGGGIAAIPLIENIFVKDLRLFSLKEFWDGMSISQITPGPILIVSAFFGYKVFGLLGALVATIGMCVPSVLLIIIIGKIHDRIKQVSIIRGIIRGFLAGFMGTLTALIIFQIQRSIVNLSTFLLVLITLLALIKIKNGFLISLAICLLYAVLFNFH